MNVLLVAATPFEVQPFLDHYKIKEGSAYVNQLNVRVLITGVGMVATSFAMGRLNEPVDLAINAGIAGAFSTELKIGEVVVVEKDTFAELGAEDGEDFLSLPDLGFGENSFCSKTPGFLKPMLGELRGVDALTVNTVHGHEASIEKTLNRYHASIESMEGAAFFYACHHLNVPSLQLRAISNRVERRNRAAWNIPLAIQSLNGTLINLVSNIL
ncbi:futalosine hydrolase [Pedobacter sp. SYSU D00535]|uniref:futalosine hydrolase n=1 Tax=Pedobacter sp. SYSU D00535 TaxID=2810308 RepID=UPI001A96943B|nr:futalosine hydrolase [Pedobacter sp. SYSU D00535]